MNPMDISGGTIEGFEGKQDKLDCIDEFDLPLNRIHSSGVEKYKSKSSDFVKTDLVDEDDLPLIQSNM